MRDLLIIACSMLLVPGVVRAQSNQSDSFSITTYYPSPYGVYRNLRLFPSQQPSAANAQQWTMFFNSSDNATYVYRNQTLGWQQIGGAGYWQMDGGNLTTVNSSVRLNVTDICSQGICLSQLKGVVGNQTLILNAHTYDSCISAGGTVVDTDVSGLKQCRFDSASCPGGWAQYKSFSATAPFTCYVSGIVYGPPMPCCNYCPPNSCQTPSHPWGNAGVESCTYCGGQGSPQSCQWNKYTCWAGTCSAAITQIGCY